MDEKTKAFNQPPSLMLKVHNIQLRDQKPSTIKALYLCWNKDDLGHISHFSWFTYLDMEC